MCSKEQKHAYILVNTLYGVVMEKPIAENELQPPIMRVIFLKMFFFSRKNLQSCKSVNPIWF